jgi:5-methylcytosine-specific restriction endonuclease McrA
MRHASTTPEQRETAKRLRYQEKCRWRRALKAGRIAEPYTLAEVAERDGYRCGICRVEVDMDLDGRLGMGPSIDHVVPISLGGDDTPANVQLAHRRCNSRKGNRAA